MSKGNRIRSIKTGWTGIVTMAGNTIVQVRFSFTTANGTIRSMKSAWRVSDLEVLEG
jgi:hypothetical protein